MHIAILVHLYASALPTWRILWDSVVEGLEKVLECVIIVGFAVEIGAALLAKLETDPETLEEVKEFVEELVAASHQE